jgi:hypothetical protein
VFPPSHAVDASQVEKSIELKDGSTVYIFKDGKMGMEDKYGRATRMKKDTVMETKDGQKIIMHGDEVMRLDEYVCPAKVPSRLKDAISAVTSMRLLREPLSF